MMLVTALARKVSSSNVELMRGHIEMSVDLMEVGEIRWIAKPTVCSGT